MSPDEIKTLIKTLRECGVTHYKTAEIELDLGPAPIALEVIDKPSEPSQEIKHKVEELTSLLKLDDNSLVNRLFPDTVQEGVEDSTDDTN